jgi:transcriptional regulator with XRE-family HTH domain
MKIESYHNWELERAIRESGKDQTQIAKAAGVDPAAFSLIKRGRMRPSDDEEKKIAAVLNIAVNKLFLTRSETINT